MRTHAFLLPRSLFGILATLAISVAVAGASAHDHVLDDGLEAHSRVCVMAGTAVLPTTDAPASVAVEPPVTRLVAVALPSSVASEGEYRRPRARAPPAIEFRGI